DVTEFEMGHRQGSDGNTTTSSAGAALRALIKWIGVYSTSGACQTRNQQIRRFPSNRADDERAADDRLIDTNLEVAWRNESTAYQTTNSVHRKVSFEGVLWRALEAGNPFPG